MRVLIKPSGWKFVSSIDVLQHFMKLKFLTVMNTHHQIWSPNHDSAPEWLCDILTMRQSSHRDVILHITCKKKKQKQTNWKINVLISTTAINLVSRLIIPDSNHDMGVYIYVTSLKHHRWSVECRETVSHCSVNKASATLPAPCVSL